MSSTRKSICFVVAVPMTASAFLLNHFEVLSREFDIYLVANFEGVNSNLKDNPNLKDIHRIGIQRDISVLKDFKSLLELRTYLKKMKFDAVLTVTPKAGLLGILAAALGGIKNRIHIFTGQVWHTKSGLFKLILMSIDKLIFNLASTVLVDGKAQREYLIKNGIIDSYRSQVLGNGSISGVDTRRFFPDQNLRERYRNQIHYQAKDLVFTFLGRLNADKGILDLAQAFEELQKKYNNVRLLLIGYDEENLVPMVKQIVSKNDLVHYFGPTTVPNEALQAADVFCLPSYREGFGSSVIEASLLELPVICSDTYGLKETIIENETGLRHKTGDSNSILVQMEKMVLDPLARLKMGEEGRKYVINNFTAESVSLEWLSFFRKILMP
jgi:glycosyltransferase involved in cell wall biosynthesis